jgi:hypothetical protein
MQSSKMYNNRKYCLDELRLEDLTKNTKDTPKGFAIHRLQTPALDDSGGVNSGNLSGQRPQTTMESPRNAGNNAGVVFAVKTAARHCWNQQCNLFLQQRNGLDLKILIPFRVSCLLKQQWSHNSPLTHCASQTSSLNAECRSPLTPLSVTPFLQLMDALRQIGTAVRSVVTAKYYTFSSKRLLGNVLFEYENILYSWIHHIHTRTAVCGTGVISGLPLTLVSIRKSVLLFSAFLLSRRISLVGIISLRAPCWRLAGYPEASLCPVATPRERVACTRSENAEHSGIGRDRVVT